MGHCSGNCSACSGCGRARKLTGNEMEYVRTLGQVAFLPVARTAADPAPAYPEREDLPLVLQCLEKKGLISLDYDLPLAGCREPGYLALPVRGSAALTARGQQVLELMEYQGVQEP